ncbi:hypothetical protein [Rhizobium sp. BK251]|uniref:hypothetical protein n=1 Tax=Rhizobium sp. BK251 TaxID=2512125 RepID=UPI00104A683D|nr:hypothetical protein [Rhizobium sp. BK251]TCL74719.1 hypothetical protein EV286_102280 [Rhizobium sp. BK251]
MTSSLLRAAISNNAHWCDAVCAVHGSPGEFASALWFHRHGTPPFYPDIVTLTDVATKAEQEEAIAAFVGREDRTWTVKDSFAALDLRPLGFNILFEAQWIGLEKPASMKPTEDVTWRVMREDTDLVFWERTWAEGNPPAAMPRIFRDKLLQGPDIAFVLVLEGEQPIGGGILNRASGVVGVSNVFAREHRGKDIWRAVLAEAAARFPEQSVVGYEHGDELYVAIDVGFQPLGYLRIWQKAA